MTEKDIYTQRREHTHPAFFWLLFGVVSVSSLGAAGPWDLRMGTWALLLGILVIVFQGPSKLAMGTVVAAGCFVILGLAPFLPVEWVGKPAWREALEDLGVETGSRVVIQWQQALESHVGIVLLFLAGLSLLKHRASPKTLRNLALLFVVWVALYSVLALVLVEQLPVSQMNTSTIKNHFGFFPNRNHAACYLAMGFVCGLGVMFQAIRDKKFARLGIGAVATLLILWAVFSWSMSRAGVVFSLVGSVIWLGLLGRRYLGKQEVKAVGLVALLAVGVYGISEFRVKDRITKTVDRAKEISESQDALEKEEALDLTDLELRVPIAMDTLQMIGAAPLTGVGAGQFRHVFPQYRDQTIVANRSTAAHPESSWFWLAAELGTPAALCLLGLVGVVFFQGVRNIRRQGGRDRAIRFGCLAAAAIVPLHSWFDVPAHRPVLALTAVMLFVLSQNPSTKRTPKVSRWPSMVLGVVLLSAAFRVFGGHWIGLDELVSVKSRENLAQGVERYQKLNDRENPLPMMKALAARQELEKHVTESLVEAPLEGRFYRIRGLANVPLAFKAEEVSRDFQIDSALTPYSVGIPMIHASALLPFNREEAKEEWLEALRLARRVDEVDESQRMEERTLKVIQRIVRKQPDLEQWFREEVEKKDSPDP